MDWARVAVILGVVTLANVAIHESYRGGAAGGGPPAAAEAAVGDGGRGEVRRAFVRRRAGYEKRVAVPDGESVQGRRRFVRRGLADESEVGAADTTDTTVPPTATLATSASTAAAGALAGGQTPAVMPVTTAAAAAASAGAQEPAAAANGAGAVVGASDQRAGVSTSSRPCLGSSVVGIPCPREVSHKSPEYNTSSCPSTYYPCTKLYKKAVFKNWHSSPQNHSGHLVPWNYFRGAAWGNEPQMYKAYAEAVDPTRYELALLQHLARNYPEMTVMDPLAKQPWWRPRDGQGALASSRHAPKLRRVLEQISNGTASLCQTKEYKWILAEPGRKSPSTWRGLMNPKLTAHEDKSGLGLNNLVPLRDACTHTLVYDVPQNCTGTVETFLEERLSGDFARDYSESTKAKLRTALDSVRANPNVTVKPRCKRTMLMPRVVPVKRPDGSVAPRAPGNTSVLCTLMYSYHGPYGKWHWGGLQQMDGFARDYGKGRQAGECEVAAPHFTDGRLLSGISARVAVYVRKALQSIAPTVLVTHVMDPMPWDRTHYGRQVYEEKRVPWSDEEDSFAMAEERNPDATSILRMPEVKAWFSINPTIKHPKLHALPIGPKCANVAHLASFFSGAAPGGPDLSQPRPFRMLVNYGAMGLSWDCECVRVMVAATGAQRWPFATVLPPSMIRAFHFDNDAFMRLLASFRFVLSPPGSGWDCYRTYETIAAGAIPILLRTGGSPLDKLHEDLPALYVNSYDDITEELLDREWERLSAKAANFNFEKLFAEYWVGHVRDVAKSGGGDGDLTQP